MCILSCGPIDETAGKRPESLVAEHRRFRAGVRPLRCRVAGCAKELAFEPTWSSLAIGENVGRH